MGRFSEIASESRGAMLQELDALCEKERLTPADESRAVELIRATGVPPAQVDRVTALRAEARALAAVVAELPARETARTAANQQRTEQLAKREAVVAEWNARGEAAEQQCHIANARVMEANQARNRIRDIERESKRLLGLEPVYRVTPGVTAPGREIIGWRDATAAGRDDE